MKNVKEIRRIRKENLSFVGSAKRSFIVREGTKETIGSVISTNVVTIKLYPPSLSLARYDAILRFCALLIRGSVATHPAGLPLLIQVVNSTNESC